MSGGTLRNVSASIRQRLLDKSRADGRTFNELLQYYSMERFLYRLSRSRYADRFILKGAMLFGAWRVDQARSTMDIDLLGKFDNTEAAIREAICGIMDAASPDDGIVYDPDTIVTSPITEDAEYHGMRVAFIARLDSARVNVKLDIGFGDIIYPGPRMIDFPTILPMPAPTIYCYSMESAMAEKLQAMVKLGNLNSRMKDFFDIWLLSRRFNFDASLLFEALRLTFSTRGTELDRIAVFPQGFALDKQVQWQAFRSRMKVYHAPELFIDVLDHIAGFIRPCLNSTIDGASSTMRWVAPGLWTMGGSQ